MVCTRTFLVLAAASIAVIAAPAHAQNVNDVRCLLVSNAASKVAKDPNEKRVVDATLHFYLGRIDGKFNATQLAAAFATEIKNIKGANIGATMQACYRHAQDRMKFVESVGKQLDRAPR